MGTLQGLTAILALLTISIALKELESKKRDLKTIITFLAAGFILLFIAQAIGDPPGLGWVITVTAGRAIRLSEGNRHQNRGYSKSSYI